MIESKDIKIGTQVRILKKNDSVNEVGDIGIITEIDCKDNDFRVFVDGRTSYGIPNRSNWHFPKDVELVEMKTTEEVKKDFPSSISIIEKFIQSQIDENTSSNEYILALNECTNLEDLIGEVYMWKSPIIIKEYGSVENYILLCLDRD
jgi:hypothetical protein